MKKLLRRLHLVVLHALGLYLLVWAGPVLPQNRPSDTNIDASSLTRQERAVLEHLRQDWSKQYRTTSIGLAAEVTGIKLSDHARLRLARFLESNRTSFPVLVRHGTTTVVLTPAEKLIARAVVLRETRDKAAARVEEVARDMGLSSRVLARPLAFLQKLGVVLAEGESKDPSYRVAPRYPRRPSSRIDFYSHQVEVNGRDRFEVA